MCGQPPASDCVRPCDVIPICVAPRWRCSLILVSCSRASGASFPISIMQVLRYGVIGSSAANTILLQRDEHYDVVLGKLLYRGRIVSSLFVTARWLFCRHHTPYREV